VHDKRNLQEARDPKTRALAIENLFKSGMIAKSGGIMELPALELSTFLLATVLALIAGALRSFFGWAENALRDGVVTKFEWQQLAGTMAIYLGGINVMAIGIDPQLATVVMVVIDMIRTGLKSLAPTQPTSTG